MNAIVLQEKKKKTRIPINRNTKSRVGLHRTQKRPVLQQVQVIAAGPESA